MKILLFSLIIVFSNLSVASPLSLVAGIRQQSADVGRLGDTAQKESVQIGLEASLLSLDAVDFISGVSYVPRKIKIKRSGSSLGNNDLYDTDYIDIPLRVQFKFATDFALWGGASLAFLVSSRCSNTEDSNPCDKKNSKDIMIPVNLGLTYDIGSHFGLGLFYEMTSDVLPPNEVTTEITSYRAGGATLIYHF